MGAWSLGSSPDKWTEILHQAKKKKNVKKVPALRVASWNIRTMLDDLTQIEDTWKIAIIDRELSSSNVDTAPLQETRLAANGSLQELPAEHK